MYTKEAMRAATTRPTQPSVQPSVQFFTFVEWSSVFAIVLNNFSSFPDLAYNITLMYNEIIPRSVPNHMNIVCT